MKKYLILLIIFGLSLSVLCSCGKRERKAQISTLFPSETETAAAETTAAAQTEPETESVESEKEDTEDPTGVTLQKAYKLFREKCLNWSMGKEGEIIQPEDEEIPADNGGQKYSGFTLYDIAGNDGIPELIIFPQSEGEKEKYIYQYKNGTLEEVIEYNISEWENVRVDNILTEEEINNYFDQCSVVREDHDMAVPVVFQNYDYISADGERKAFSLAAWTKTEGADSYEYNYAVSDNEILGHVELTEETQTSYAVYTTIDDNEAQFRVRAVKYTDDGIIYSSWSKPYAPEEFDHYHFTITDEEGGIAEAYLEVDGYSFYSTYYSVYGRLELGLLDGEHTVRVSAFGYSPAEIVLPGNNEPGTESEIKVTLSKDGKSKAEAV